MKRSPWKYMISLGLALSVGLAAPTAQSQTRSNPSKTRGNEPKISIQQLTLKNGMRVVLSEDHAAPTISLCITYDVGSRNERPGRTGFAHLFEHLMFQGSQNVGK